MLMLELHLLNEVSALTCNPFDAAFKVRTRCDQKLHLLQDAFLLFHEGALEFIVDVLQVCEKGQLHVNALFLQFFQQLIGGFGH